MLTLMTSKRLKEKEDLPQSAVVHLVEQEHGAHTGKAAVRLRQKTTCSRPVCAIQGLSQNQNQKEARTYLESTLMSS